MDNNVLNSVTSRLNPNINYEYGMKINKNDKNKSGTVETINFAGKQLDITVGVAHPIYSNRGDNKTLIYYNIYLVDVKTMKVEKKIGIYEILNSKLVDVYTDRELDITKLGKPLFFPSEFRELYPDLSYKETNNIVSESLPDEERDEEQDEEPDEEPDEDIESVDDKSTIDESDIETNDGDSEVDEDEDDEDEKVLHIETPDENAKIIENCTPNDDDNWIQRKFKNKNYEILPGNNDKSLFEVLRQSFDDESTSVAQIREIASTSITIDDFLKYRNIYDNLLKQKEDINRKIQENLDSQQKTLPNMDRTEQLHIASNEDKRKKEYSKLNKEYNMIKGHLSYYSFMDNVVNLEQLQRVVLSNIYWGDNIAISLIERLLYEDKLKIIVLLQDKSREGDMAKIVNCNNYNAIELNDQQIVRPKNYVILSLSGKNYSVVSYKGKKIMSYDEIPYGIKRRITDNCTNVI